MYTNTLLIRQELNFAFKGKAHPVFLMYAPEPCMCTCTFDVQETSVFDLLEVASQLPPV